MTEKVLLRMSDWLLQAYADDELPSEQSSSVERELNRRPELAASTRAWRDQAAALHRLYDHHLDTPLPAATRQLAEKLSSRLKCRKEVRARRWKVSAIAAMVAFLTFGLGLAGYQLGSRMQTLDGPAATFGPGLAGLHLAANSATATVIGPDLSAFGYELVSAAGPSEGTLGAVANYRSRDGAYLTLFAIDPQVAASGRLAFTEKRPSSVLIWHDGDELYGLVGDASSEMLDRLSRALNAAAPTLTAAPDARGEADPIVVVDKET